MLAVQLGLSSLLDQIQNRHIRLILDNMTTVTYINAIGGCQSKDCDTIAKDIWLWAIAQNNWLSATHTPGQIACLGSLTQH